MASDHGICHTPGTPGKGLDASSNLERRPRPGVGELKSSWFPDSCGWPGLAREGRLRLHRGRRYGGQTLAVSAPERARTPLRIVLWANWWAAATGEEANAAFSR